MVERVPADVRNLDGVSLASAAQAVAAARRAGRGPGQLRRFLAALEQPLHAETDAEQRPAFADAGRGWPSIHSRVERRGGAEVADARHDDAASRPTMSAGDAGTNTSAPMAASAFLHRGQVAGAVVDERDHSSSIAHSSPFVLGSIRASRLSFAQATRSARANALNTASILWWLERPYITFTWTLARAPMREALEEVVDQLGLQIADAAAP